MTLSRGLCLHAKPTGLSWKAFHASRLEAGETVTFKFEVAPERDLSFVTSDGTRFVDPGEYIISAGGKSLSIRVK